MNQLVCFDFANRIALQNVLLAEFVSQGSTAKCPANSFVFCSVSMPFHYKGATLGRSQFKLTFSLNSNFLLLDGVDVNLAVDVIRGRRS